MSHLGLIGSELLFVVRSLDHARVGIERAAFVGYVVSFSVVSGCVK